MHMIAENLLHSRLQNEQITKYIFSCDNRIYSVVNPVEIGQRHVGHTVVKPTRILHVNQSSVFYILNINILKCLRSNVAWFGGGQSEAEGVPSHLYTWMRQRAAPAYAPIPDLTSPEIKRFHEKCDDDEVRRIPNLVDSGDNAEIWGRCLMVVERARRVKFFAGIALTGTARRLLHHQSPEAQSTPALSVIGISLKKDHCFSHWCGWTY